MRHAAGEAGGRVDATVSWTSLKDHSQLSLYARNPFDRPYIISPDASTLGDLWPEVSPESS
jgi:hypothetical protein